jgi:hypothetical protein
MDTVVRSKRSYSAQSLRRKSVHLPNAQACARDFYAGISRGVSRSEDPVTETRFGLSLSERGFQEKPTNKGIIYIGIGLRPNE